jgi:hypothetical protein
VHLTNLVRNGQQARTPGNPHVPGRRLPGRDPALSPRPDIQAGLSLLGRLGRPDRGHGSGSGGRLQLFDTDLRGALLVGANLQAALLGGVHLRSLITRR